MRRAIKIALVGAALALVVFGRCDLVMYAAPGARVVREVHQEYKSRPLVLGLPADTCRVFVVTRTTGYGPIVSDGVRVDMCADTVGPYRVAEVPGSMQYTGWPDVPVWSQLRFPRLSLFGFTYRRPAITTVGIIWPVIGLEEYKCGIVTLGVPKADGGKVLARIFVWNSRGEYGGGKRFVSPSLRQVGLVWPIPGGWGVWVWSMNVEGP